MTGAGYAGLSLLAGFQTDLTKLDVDLIRGIDQSEARRFIVSGAVGIATALNIAIIAEGDETHSYAGLFPRPGSLKEARIPVLPSEGLSATE